MSGWPRAVARPRLPQSRTCALPVVGFVESHESRFQDIVCPDWWYNLDGNNKDVFYVGFNFAKCGIKNTIAEKDHHNIFKIDIHPAPDKTRTSIAVPKTRPLVCFWGATGEATK
jgi:hypothetical protein